MATFLFSYRVPLAPLSEALAGLDADGRAARIDGWNNWLASMGSALLERGRPVGDARVVGNGGPDTRLGGYSLVEADDLDQAIALAVGCPGLEWGGGVEVGSFVELPASAGNADAARPHS